MTPSEAVPLSAQIELRPTLMGRRILVVDDDESVLQWRPITCWSVTSAWWKRRTPGTRRST